MVSRFWFALGRVSLLLLVMYLILSYVLLITIILRQEITILDASKAISVFNTKKGDSSLQGQVRNVFGDPVPFSVIIFGEHIVQADKTGTFTLAHLASGRYTMEIFAGDYEKYSREVQIETGVNSPTIKYDTGLWPQIFLVDFHIFSKNSDEIIGIVGFANGTTELIFIQQATLLNPQGEVITDVLHDHDGFNYYANLSNKLEIVENPQKALKWAPRMVQGGEFPAIKGSFLPGIYTLEVHYAFQKGHDLGQYRVLTMTDLLEPDKNWDPHL